MHDNMVAEQMLDDWVKAKRSKNFDEAGAPPRAPRPPPPLIAPPTLRRCHMPSPALRTCPAICPSLFLPPCRPSPCVCCPCASPPRLPHGSVATADRIRDELRAKGIEPDKLRPDTFKKPMVNAEAEALLDDWASCHAPPHT